MRRKRADKQKKNAEKSKQSAEMESLMLQLAGDRRLKKKNKSHAKNNSSSVIDYKDMAKSIQHDDGK